MAKKDMKRHYTHDKKAGTPVPELQGKAKSTKQRANPIIAGTKPPAQKVWHNAPLPESAAKPVIVRCYHKSKRAIYHPLFII